MKNITLLFPGQGSQYEGMGKKLYDNYSVAKHIFHEANDALGFDLKELCFSGSLDELTKTENAQPAILTCSVAAYEVYMKEFGILPTYYAGHSLGELSALASAGIFSFADSVKIVRERGRLMQEAAASGVGAMAAVSGIDKNVLKAKCEEYSNDNSIVVISNYNSPDQIVISGHKSAVEKLSLELKSINAMVVPLKVSAPFHSPLMETIKGKFREVLESYPCGDFKGTVISNVTGLPHKSKDILADLLTEQLVQPVQWESTMKFLYESGVRTVMEIGPKTVLANLAVKNIPDIKAFSYDKSEDIEKFRKIINNNTSGRNENIPESTVVTRCLAIAVCTKNKNWDNEEYQKGVIEPYRRIQRLQEELDKTGDKPSLEQMKEALEMLKSVFETKKTPVQEQIERYNQVFDETGTRHLFADFIMPNQ